MTESSKHAALILFEPLGMEDVMSVASHVEELRRKHQKLSDAVERAQKSPGSSDLELSALKREKLRLKEQISRYAH
ncbi:YdcH family protein [Paracoccus sp. 1_MG-2023]|uniref:YdcH family protein n=2 Tax=unclassified Paracoccus (in: a-proteobacteria) TaxID=2688777 RepID=UPI0034C62DB4